MEQKRCFGCMELTDQPVCPRCGWSAQHNNEFHQLPVGTVLADKYLVGRALGQGGFGITYIGWDTNLDIRVCVKEFFPMSTVNRDHSIANTVNCNATVLMNGYASSRERFLREAKSMAKFRDVPQIVSIFDFFQANNTAYMVMQYIEGIDLAKYVARRGGRIGMDETLRILKPIMEALSLVHEAGMIHRDIAPDNIMLHPREGAKLLDFGAVRQVENPDADKELTRSTEAILKNGFAPMEQYQSRGSLGPWTDVYALSATIYYCVTGRIPTEALTRMVEETPLDWSGAEGITRRQIEVLEQGMAVLSKNRIQSVKELMAGLYAPEKPEPQPVPKPQPQREPELKHDPPLNTPRVPQPEPKPQPESKQRGDSLSGKERHIPQKRVVAAVAISILLLCALGAYGWLHCWFGHVWSEASCTSPKACIRCGVQAGNTLSHQWSGATCTSPKNCIICGTQEGDVLPHQWSGATCTSPQTCIICGAQEGDVLPHQWNDATCTSPKTCIFCGAYEEPSTHVWYGSGGYTATCMNCSMMRHTMVSSDNVGDLEVEQRPKTFIWGQSVYRRQDVTSIVFSGKISAAPDKAWDVSAARDGSILAWLDNGRLTITSDGIISANPNASWLFAHFSNLKSIDFAGIFDTSDATTMNAMFAGCNTLQTLDLSGFITNKVYDMGGMFHRCYKLKSVDVSSFDTAAVQYLGWMFAENHQLTDVDVSGFDISNVNDISGMFLYCENLQNIDISGFKFSNIKNLSWMFEGCNKLKNIQIDSFDVGKVMYYEGFLPDGATINGIPWREYFEN